MESSSTCFKCGSEKLMPGLAVSSTDRSQQVGVFVAVQENPGALFFKGQHEGGLTVTVCGECGYAELYVPDADLLYDVYSRAGDEES